MLVTLAAPCAAETRQYGNIVFDIPEGWKIGAVNDGLQYIIPEDFDGRCGRCRIQLSLGRAPVPGQALTAVLDAQRTLFVDEDERDDVVVVRPAAAFCDAGREVGMVGQMVDGDTLQVVFAVRMRDRIEVMAFHGPAGDETELAVTATMFSDQALPLFTRARFVSDGAEPLLPPPRRGDLDGLYYGLSTSWSLGFDGMMKMDLNHRIFVFWKDGHFYDGTRPDGLRSPDPAALMAVGDSDVGTYFQRRREIVLTYASGDTETIESGRGVLQDGNCPLVRGEPVKGGTRIDGMVSNFNFTAFAPGFSGGGGLTASSSVGYAPDGTWTSDAWADAAASFDNGAATPHRPAAATAVATRCATA